MARLFGDGFDHYGDDESNMLDGVYGTVGGTLSSTYFATGTHSFAPGIDSNSAVGGLRKVLPGSARSKVGCSARFYFPSLPQANTVSCIFDFLSASANRSQVACYVDSNGRFIFRKDGNWNLNGEVGTDIATSDPEVTAAAWHHIEVQVYSHATAGWVRVAVNGVHRFQAENLDTYYDSSGIISIANHQPYYGSATIYDGTFYMDDYTIYDFTGTPSTDTDWCPTYDGSGLATGYIGELEGLWEVPSADTAEDDWVASTGSDAYAMVDETTPNDTDYAYSTAAGDLSEFEMTDLPAEITYIRGIDYWGRMSKADAGAAMTKFGAKSAAAVTDAPERPITIEPTYWWDQINLDPNTAARWTRAGFNASKYRLTRSA